jgi:GNAT superfamily N-acetyltransferase
MSDPADPASAVRPITAEETIAVRWPILRAGLPRETAIFPGDSSPETQHFGAFDGGQLIGVASIYRAPLPERPEAAGAWQLRGMATLPEVQGRGFGRALVEACLAAVRGAGGTILWCNARTPAAGFYRRQEFAGIGEEFEIPTAGPHLRMWRDLRGGEEIRGEIDANRENG